MRDEDVQEYLHLHHLRWGRDSVAVNALTHDFHKCLARTLATAAQFTLFFARLQGRRIAAHACIDVGDRREYYFSGRDLEQNKLPVGKVLCYHTIVDAIETGLRFYDFGYGGDEYKSIFTKTNRTVRCLLVAQAGAAPDLDALFPKYEYMAREVNAHPTCTAPMSDDASDTSSMHEVEY